MVNFLIKRPIAVSMTFLALLILGLVALFRMPVSLMPDIAIPRMTVEASLANAPAREMEQVVLKPLRRQLMQVPQLKDITSEARDGSGTIHLTFNYGSNMDYGFMQVNEKIDRAMNRLPREMNRPRVIKAAATDIPVFYLFVARRQEHTSPTQFLQLSRFADQVIKRRLEQIPEVAMVDISGQMYPEIAILPKHHKLKALQLNPELLIQKIRAANIAVGNLRVRDGHYQYNIRLNTALSGKKDIANLQFYIRGEIYKLHELADIQVRPQKREGLVTADNREAVALAVVKRANARIADLEKQLRSKVKEFHTRYPHTRFTVMRDQTRLLDYSITSVRQTLLLGTALAFLLMFFFLRDRRAPWLIGLTIPASLIVSILFFYLMGLSINIISLSGLILGIGLMIDNAIIVIDNIMQQAARGAKWAEAGVKGTNEVIRPLLSSVLTTSAVFLPLIFISGMAGALFYDQAVAISVGLLASFLVSITLLPVYFYVLYRNRPLLTIQRRYSLHTFYHRWYERALFYLLRKPIVLGGLLAFIVVAGILVLFNTPKRRLPPITRDAVMVQVDWNEKIHIEENRRRSQALIRRLKGLLAHASVYAGRQQFLMEVETPEAPQEALIYLKASNARQRRKVAHQTERFLAQKYPQARFSMHAPENLFQMVFRDAQPPLVARMMPFNKQQDLQLEDIRRFTRKVHQKMPAYQPERVPAKTHVAIQLNAERILLYNLNRKQVTDKLSEIFNAYRITALKSSNRFTPVILGENSESLHKKLQKTFVMNNRDKLIPLRAVLNTKRVESLKVLKAGQEGPFYPLHFQVSSRQATEVKQVLKQLIRQQQNLDIAFTGSLFENQALMREIALILFIAVTLLYFILAAQFESLVLPLIVLAEIPVSMTGAFLILWLFGGSINIMVLIGLIVMTGIIINDSILKIDTMNRLHRAGMTPLRAVVTGGARRLKPILMTSLTTILAMLPFLFISGLSSDLQGPLAITIIGGMFFGTFVSLFLIPAMYLALKRKTTQKYPHGAA